MATKPKSRTRRGNSKRGTARTAARKKTARRASTARKKAAKRASATRTKTVKRKVAKRAVAKRRVAKRVAAKRPVAKRTASKRVVAKRAAKKIVRKSALKATLRPRPASAPPKARVARSSTNGAREHAPPQRPAAPPPTSELTYNGIGDAAVREKTGKGWNEWFEILDREGAATMDHTAITTLLYEGHGCPGWWDQMVTVGYEQARGMREKFQKADVFSASKSVTVEAPLARVFAAWDDPATRDQWLREPITIRKATPEKSMRITWSDGASSVEVNFYPKGGDKSMVQVQHNKLPDAGAVTEKKAFWEARLAKLRELIET